MLEVCPFCFFYLQVQHFLQLQLSSCYDVIDAEKECMRRARASAGKISFALAEHLLNNYATKTAKYKFCQCRQCKDLKYLNSLNILKDDEQEKN